MAKNKIKLILASGSPRRKEFLGHLQLPFEIIVKNLPEESDHTDPVKFAKHISEIKGEAVFLEQTQNSLVISADTIVSFNSRIYGKPKDVDEARSFLYELSGKTHSVFTGVTLNLLYNGKRSSHSFVEESKVTFNVISEKLMENYLSTKDSLDKAGAYGIQGPSLTFISRVEGDYANVAGLPLSRLVLECEAFLQPLTQGSSWFDLF